MSVNSETLRTLHRLHRQQADLRDRLQRGPQRVQANANLVKKLEEDLVAAKEAVKRARITADQKNLQLREREERVALWRKRMNEAQNNREYQTLKEQIAADEQANSVLSDEVLEALEKIELQQKVVATAEATLVKGREEAAKATVQVNSERDTFEGELGRVMAELKTLEATLPPAFRGDYDNAIHGRGEDGMAPLEGEACGGCYQNVTPQVFDHVASGKPAFCKNCGRLLYMPENGK